MNESTPDRNGPGDMDRGAVNLNFTDEEIARAGDLLTQLLRSLERSSGTRPVFPQLDRDGLARMLATPFPEHGVGINRLFRDINERVLPNSTAIAHPRFLAYVQGPPTGIAPFADAIAAALNQNCNIWQLSPAASVIERKVLTWLSGLFGYPDASGGLLTSGGSMATLVALSAALHDRSDGDFRQSGLQSTSAPLVVYTSEEAHRCVEKGAVILGLGSDHVRKIPVDARSRLRVDALDAAIRRDREAGRRPFCVVATAGTVTTGAIDPIDEIADLCTRENLWLHVDGAFGALFILSDRIAPHLRPCGRADSIALDPHKLLFAPLEAGCVVVRDRRTLTRAFAFAAPYMTVDDDPLFTDYVQYGPELSRSFKAFKIWCALETFGLTAFREAVDRTLDLARYMGERIQAEPALELLAPVGLNAVCFRFRGADDDANHAILASLVNEGTALLGPVRINNRRGVRACITNYRTRKSDIDLVLERFVRLGESQRSV